MSSERSVKDLSGLYSTSLEARVGFEPTNGGFADLSLGPLGYRAELLSIAKLAQALGVTATDRNCRCLILNSKQVLCASSSETNNHETLSGIEKTT